MFLYGDVFVYNSQLWHLWSILSIIIFTNNSKRFHSKLTKIIFKISAKKNFKRKNFPEWFRSRSDKKLWLFACSLVQLARSGVGHQLDLRIFNWIFVRARIFLIRIYELTTCRNQFLRCFFAVGFLECRKKK